MIRIRIFFVMLTALLTGSRLPVFGQVDDTLSISDKVNRSTSFATGFRGDVWRNPALYYYYSPFAWTTLDVNGSYNDKGNAAMKQEGDEDTRWGVDVHSFVILSPRDRVFGAAGYRSEKQENVLWNENTDWKLVAPYVTGDSIGGFLKGETYYFRGGYAGELDKWTWGIEGAYRASHNYRDMDPRPRNTVSDLSFTLGAGYELGYYRLAFSGDFRYYQQRSEISFLADKGSTSVYHTLGLGMDYIRFAGNLTDTKYQGIEWGGTVGLLPANTENGVSASVSVKHMAMDKKLSSANDLTLLKLGTTDLKGNVTWMQTLATGSCIAAKLDAGYTIRQGKENVYGEAGGSSFGTLISTNPGIKITNYRIAAGALWEKTLGTGRTWGGAVVPRLAYQRTEADYATVSRFIHWSSFESSLRARLQHQKKRLKLTLEANGGYYANLSAEQTLPGLDIAKSSAQTLLANAEYLSDSYSMAGIRLRGDYPMTKQYSLFLSAEWQTAHYKKCGTTRYAACSLGIFF